MEGVNDVSGEQEIARYFHELVAATGTPHARSIMFDCVWALEERAFSRRSLSSRDTIVEARLREVLNELTKGPTATSRHHDLAIDLIDALLPLEFTDRAAKFPRLCRSLLALMKAGNEAAAKRAAGVFGRALAMAENVTSRNDDAVKILREAVLSEIGDMCDLLQNQLHARTQARGGAGGNGLATMLACQTIASHQPRYLAQTRAKIISIAISACGAADTSMRGAAFACLSSLLSQPASAAAKQHDLALESNRLVDEALKSFRSGNTNDSLHLSAVLTLKALFAARGGSAIEKAKLQNACVAVLTVHKSARSPAVRLAILDSIVVLARVDPAFKMRQTLYCGILVDPIRNLRDMSNKPLELRAVAAFIRDWRYDVFDIPSKVNVETIVLSLATKSSGLQVECWEVISAIATSGGDAKFLRSVVDKCVPFLSRVPLTQTFLGVVQPLADTVEELRGPLNSAINTIIDRNLRSIHFTDDPGVSSSAVTPPQTPRQKTGFFGAIFSRESSSSTTTTTEPSPSSSPSQTGALSIDEIECTLAAHARRPILSVRASAEELRGNVLPLLRHPVIQVRAAASRVLVEVLHKSYTKLIAEAPPGALLVGQKKAAEVTVSPLVRPPGIPTARGGGVPWEFGATETARRGGESAVEISKKLLVDVVDAFLRNSLLETEAQLRLQQMELLHSERLTDLLTPCIAQLMAFLNDHFRIREAVLKLIVQLASSETFEIVAKEISPIIQGCVVTLEYTTDQRSLVKQLTDLAAFTVTGLRVMGPFIKRIVVAIKERVDKETALGELTLVSMIRIVEDIAKMVHIDMAASGRDGFISDLELLVPSVIAILCGKGTIAMQLAAIRALNSLLQASPDVFISPEDRLLVIDSLSSLFLAATSSSSRILISSIFGQIGAVAPNLQLQPSDEVDHQLKERRTDEDINSHDYDEIVYHAITSALEDTLHESQLTVMLRTLLQLVKKSSPSVVRGLSAIKSVVKLVMAFEGQPGTQAELLHTLSALVSIRREQALAMLSEIIVLLKQCWNPLDPIVFAAVLSVVDKINVGSLDATQIDDEWPWLFPKLTDAAMCDASPSCSIAGKIVDIFKECTTLSAGAVQYVIPCLTSFISRSEKPSALRCAAATAAVNIVCERRLDRHLPPLLHALRRVSRHVVVDAQLASEFNESVAAGLQRLSADFPNARSIVRTIQHECIIKLEGNGGAEAGLERTRGALGTSVVTAVQRDRTMSHQSMFEGEPSLGLDGSEHKNISIILAHVEGALVASNGGSGVSWKRWFAEFQRLLFACSPHFSFRMCVPLYDKNERLRRQLLNPSFMCFLQGISSEETRQHIGDVLRRAMASSEAEIVATCLGLSDYLERCDQFTIRSSQEKAMYSGTDDSYNSACSHNSTGSIPNSVKRKLGKARCDRHQPLGDEEAENGTSMHRKPQVQNMSSLFSSVESGSALDIDEHVGAAAGAAVFGSQPSLLTSTTTAPRSISAVLHSQQSFGLAGRHPTLAEAISRHRATGGKGVALGDASAAAEAAAHPNAWVPVTYSPRRLHRYDIIPLSSLLKAALHNRMFAKGIRYAEMQLRRDNSNSELVEQLARLYNAVGMQSSVVGLYESVPLQPTSVSFEHRQWWNAANRAYKKDMEQQNLTKDALTNSWEGYVRTFALCGSWKSTMLAARQYMKSCGVEKLTNVIATSAALAGWMLQEWDDVKQCLSQIDESGLLFVFTSAIVLREGSPAQLRECIQSGRQFLDQTLRAMLPLGYHQAYETLTELQHLQEIEEAHVYRVSDSAHRGKLRRLWHERMVNLRNDAITKLMSLAIHALVVEPHEIAVTWLHFCDSVRLSHSDLASWAMERLQSGSTGPGRGALAPTGNLARALKIGRCTHLWSAGDKGNAVAELEKTLMDETQSARREFPLITMDPACDMIAQGWMKLSRWKMERGSFWAAGRRAAIIKHLLTAVECAPDEYEPWHEWGLMNYRVQQRDKDLPESEREIFVVKAHQGFTAAICRSTSAVGALQDVLRLLQLWIQYGGASILSGEHVSDAIQRIPVTFWVDVVPQLIAHLGHKDQSVRTIMCSLLRLTCKEHPQAAIFPLTVPLLSESTLPQQERRAQLAEQLLRNTADPLLVRNIRTIAELLISVAALPIENLREMLGGVLRPLQDLESEKAPQLVPAIRQIIAFVHRNAAAFERVGPVAQHLETLARACSTSRERAYSFCRRLYNEVEAHVNQITVVKLSVTAPQLLNVKDFGVSVPGEYFPSTDEFPTMMFFHERLTVIPSKHRPRKLAVTGSTGEVSTYCLKANEDCRIDERVMQLFWLVNSLMGKTASHEQLRITRFHVTPLSSKVGMLGWVENTETLHQVVTRNRSRLGEPANHEMQILNSMVPGNDFHYLSNIQKVELFECVHMQTHGSDVAQNMWQASETAESWLERRKCYTQSLALMSMVGFVLGLGDRHMGNLLMNIKSGQIVHIDFGDCFDVARLRTAFPETVPFRLTRMLVNAMEVFGVGGEFKHSATRSMETLRLNRDSIVALLSAFIYDPTVNSRVIEKIGSPEEVVERIRCKLEGVEYLDVNAPPRDAAMPLALRPDVAFYRSTCDKAVLLSGARRIQPVEDQVQMLISEATSLENLSELFSGWCPLW